jgi:hypothetical protein
MNHNRFYYFLYVIKVQLEDQHGCRHLSVLVMASECSHRLGFCCDDEATLYSVVGFNRI